MVHGRRHIEGNNYAQNTVTNFFLTYWNMLQRKGHFNKYAIKESCIVLFFKDQFLHLKTFLVVNLVQWPLNISLPPSQADV